MAHYAFLDEANIVVEVIVGRDEGDGGVDWEQHYASVRGLRCLRTSYRTQGGQHPEGSPFRLNYAGIGYTYREDLNGFVPPCPGEGWELDESTGTWAAPSGAE